MDSGDARARCQEFVKTGMLRHHAKSALKREGFDEQEIEEAISEYDALRSSHQKRQRSLTRLWAGAMFLICGVLFLYFAFLSNDERHTAHFWLLAPACFGLFKMLLLPFFKMLLLP